LAGLQKILLAEDDLYIRDIYNVVLQKAGFSVEQAENGQQALEKTLSFNPDVLLLDIMMPDIDGLEVLRRLRTDEKYKTTKPKIIIVTNLAQEDTAEQAKKYGAEGYVVKADIEPHDLVTMIQTLGPTATNKKS
jgi:CheY-like chemotaxis protein